MEERQRTVLDVKANLPTELEGELRGEPLEGAADALPQGVCMLPLNDDVLHVQQWCESFVDTVVYFHVLHMKDSLFVWIGSSPATVANLCVAMTTRIGTSGLPSVSPLRGIHSDGEEGQRIARHLAKKLDSVVYCSYNLTSQPMIIDWSERCLSKRLTRKNE